MIIGTIDEPGSSMQSTAKLKGKNRARKMLRLLQEERVRTYQQIEERCKQSQNLITNIRHAAIFAQKAGDGGRWGELGPDQGNLGRHIDALSAYAFGLEQAITLLYQVLEEEPPKQDNPFTQTKEDKKDEHAGQEQARSQGRQAAGTQARAVEGPAEPHKPAYE